MNYTAMTLASNAPPVDPHGAHISFGTVVVVALVIWGVVWLCNLGKGNRH